MKRVLIYEPEHSGHRLEYASILVGSLSQLPGVRVILATTDASVASEEFATFLSPVMTAFELHIIPPVHVAKGFASLRLAYGRYRQLLSLWTKLKPDRTIIISGDGLFQIMTISQLFPSTVETRTAFRQTAIILYKGLLNKRASAVSRIQNLVERWAIVYSKWGRMFHINLPNVNSLRRRYRVAKALQYLPDPVAVRVRQTRMNARLEAQLPIEGVYISLVGAINLRKGADWTIRAFSHLCSTDDSGKFRLLLAGRISAEVNSLLASDFGHLLNERRIITIDRFLGEREIGCVLDASDVISLAYRDNNQPSGILLHALYAKLGVVYPEGGWFDEELTPYGIGVKCQCDSVDSLSSAFRQAGATINETAYELFLSDHDPKNFCEPFRDFVNDIP